LSSPLDPKEVVRFIKENPKLDKKQIGEFISNKKYSAVLEEYQKYVTMCLNTSSTDTFSDAEPHAGSGEYGALHSFVDFGTIYIYTVCWFTLYTSSLILFSSLFSCLSFSSRIDPLHFQAGGRKR